MSERQPAHASTGHEQGSIDENGRLRSRQLCRNERVAPPITVEAISSYSINNLIEIRVPETPSESEKGFNPGLWQLCRNQCGTSDTPVEGRSSHKDAHNFNRKSTNEGVMQELLADDAIQCEHTLLNLLKSKYPFREETNQNILYDYEIRRLADFYNITDCYPVLACYDIIFWLKGLDGAIYMWSRQMNR
ncbi:hypothetical protein RhiirC2_779457 [Rhizophagus irregularis]|uniref:Uncharacterized protein n=1 Tax=Rhizophagus irregularis TaxID=588596 RepID=A0A2N1N9P6_9GLOM|nr:hypothetical protein RhiirC2_779457 [Rhizophagus irregularis]